MHLNTIFIVSLAAVANAVTTTFNTGVCYTYMTSTSRASVPTTTSSYTGTLSFTYKKTIYRTSTVVGPTVTSTSTVYTTKTSTSTAVSTSGTLTVLSTAFTTQTSTAVSSSTTVFTSTETTISTLTSTIATSSGFVPLQDDVANQGYVPSKRDVEVAEERRELVPRAERRPKVYPYNVVCTRKNIVLAIITSTVSGSKVFTTTAKPGTTVVYSTSSLVVTSTVTQAEPAVVTTSTSTSTLSTVVTSSSTVFTTTTVTTTEVASTVATYNPVCQPNNFLRRVNGNAIDYFRLENYNSYIFVEEAKDAAACCNACLNAGTRCGVAVTYGPQECYLFPQKNDGCVAGDAAGQFTTNSKYMPQPQDALTLFNSNCGRFSYDVGRSL